MKKTKIISLICVFAMLVGCFASFSAVAATTEKNYTYNDRGGVEGMTYLIDNTNFLDFWEGTKHQTVVGTYKLTEDIVLNTGDASKWSDSANRVANQNGFRKSWNTPIGGVGSFKGTFDGQGHSISGICLVAADQGHYAGLFGKVDGGTVKNVSLINSYIEAVTASNGSLPSGSIVALLNNGTVENCYSEAIMNNLGTAVGDPNSATVGGIVGRAIGTSNIKNCVFAGKIIATVGPTGGILGSNNAGYSSTLGANDGGKVTVSDCLNLGAIYSNSYNAPIVGRAYKYQNREIGVTIKDCMNLSKDMGSTQWQDGELIGVGDGCFTVENYILVEGFRIPNVKYIGNAGNGTNLDIKRRSILFAICAIPLV